MKKAAAAGMRTRVAQEAAIRVARVEATRVEAGRVRVEAAEARDAGLRIASIGTPRTSSARIRHAACTGRATRSIAATIAATPGRRSARTCRAISIATRS